MRDVTILRVPRRSNKAQICLYLILVSIECFFLISCDGAARVRGKIVSNSGDDVGNCYLEFYIEDGNELLNKLDIQSEFDENFTISPFRKKYYFIISCTGCSSFYKTKTYEMSGTKYLRNPIELGNILLESKDPGKACNDLDEKEKKAFFYLIDHAYRLGLVKSEDSEDLFWGQRIISKSGKKILPCLLEIYHHGLQHNSQLWPLKTESPKQGRWTIDLISAIDPPTAIKLYREWRAEPGIDYLKRISIDTELANLGDTSYLKGVVDFLMSPQAVSEDRKQGLRFFQERAVEVISILNYRPALPALKYLQSENGPSYAKYWRWLPIYIAQLSGDHKALLDFAKDSERFGWALKALKRMGRKDLLQILATDYKYPYRSLAQTLLESDIRR